MYCVLAWDSLPSFSWLLYFGIQALSSEQVAHHGLFPLLIPFVQQHLKLSTQCKVLIWFTEDIQTLIHAVLKPNISF